MPRIQFSDVTPPERRSIRDVPIPSGGKRKVPIFIKPENSQNSPVPSFNSKMSETTEKKKDGPYEYYYPKNKIEPEQSCDNFGKSKKKFVFGGIALFVVAIFIIGMMTVFASATINIVPKNQNVDVNMTIIATSKTEEGAVSYEVIKISKSKNVSVPATGEEAVEVKASGKIMIYNNFSSEPQRLIIRTRFETKEGLIYRIPESVIVPGKTIKNGTETPGSVEVEIFADEPGDKYNIKKTDFTIPGFKNDTNRYKNFYARSVTEMVGGFVGKRKTILPTDKQTALQNIDLEVQADLKKDLQSKIPDGLTLLSDSVLFKSNELPQKESGSSVIVEKEITAYAIMLNAQNLSDQITKQYVSESPNWSGIESEIKNFSLLNVAEMPNDLKTGEKINLQINGKVKVWAKIDTNIINQRLLGVPKKEVAKLMDEFAGISSITATIRPIWKQSFPRDSLKIHVQTLTNE